MQTLEYGSAEIKQIKYFHIKLGPNGCYGILYAKEITDNHRPGDWKMYLNLTAQEIGQLMGGN